MGIKLKKMKIFSQSTACAFFAVANGLSFRPGADPDRVWQMTQSWLCTHDPESIWCPPANFVRKEIQLYGGWDLPVPQYIDPNYSTNRDPNQPRVLVRVTRGCSMSHLPKRGETGSMKAVDCSAKEIQQFKEGNGPTGFTGIFSDSRRIVNQQWKIMMSIDPFLRKLAKVTTKCLVTYTITKLYLNLNKLIVFLCYIDVGGGCCKHNHSVPDILNRLPS